MKAKSKPGNSRLSETETEEIIQILKRRFEKNMNRHKGISWEDVAKKLE